MKKTWMKPLLIVVAVVLLAAAVFCAMWIMDPLDCRMAKDVTIGGLKVEGMTLLQAWKAVKTAAENTVEATTLTVELPEETLSISPEEAGIGVKAWAAVANAYRVGRKETAEGPDFALSQYLVYEEDALRERLVRYAARYDTNLTQPSWKLRGQVPDLSTQTYDPSAAGQTVELTLGLPERRLNVDTVLNQILASYDHGLAGVKAVTLDIEASKLPEEPDLEGIYQTCALPAKNDALDMQIYEIAYGSYGYHFDMEKAKEMVAQASYGAVLSIPMEVFAPEIYREGVYFRDVLGTCETKHTADENRNTNLRLVCEFLDGRVIQPGEEFSYNMAVGERTEERGFMPATVFSGNRKTKDFGGGVCQGSTTLYNCLLEADMEILERHGHGALITYVPLGLDAAVNWLTKTDLIFKNNSHFPVKIQAEVSDGYMKMKLLGTDEKDYYIELEAKSYKEGDYYYAASYKNKYDKETKEHISRDRIVFSSYVAELEG